MVDEEGIGAGLEDGEGFQSDPELEADGSYTIEAALEGEVPLANDFGANLALTLSADQLDKLGRDLAELIEQDILDREKRDKQYKEGIQRTGMDMDAQTPGGAEFEGASKVVHPMLAQATVEFASRAIKELFPPNGPVKTAILGEISQGPMPQPVGAMPSGTAENNNGMLPGQGVMPLPYDAKMQQAENKRDFLNWQLIDEIKEYRGELEQLLTQLPLGGSQYQKIYFDGTLGRIRAEFVPIDEFILPYSASSLDTALRATHLQRITSQELEDRVESGLYMDLGGPSPSGAVPERTQAGKQTEKIEGKSEPQDNEDGLQDFFECHCLYKVEGEAKPYIISIRREDKKVAAVYRNWEETDKYSQRVDWFVDWTFIPWRGAVGVGLPHLIGGMSIAATGALRALLDSAHINNFPAAVKLKSPRGNGATIQLNATGISDIDAPAGVDDIRKAITGLPFNPPSTVLFQLLEWLTASAKEMVATTSDQLGNVGDRTPVGTTMAIIEQGSTTYSSIHARLHFSQYRALQIIQRLNSQYLNDDSQIKALGKVLITKESFLNSKDVCPVSDPNIFSESQRYAQNQAIQQLAGQSPNLPWNMLEINRRFLRLLHCDNVDAILPLPPQPYTNDDPAQEHPAVLQGQQLTTAPQQNHLMHIASHLSFIIDPVFGAASPGTPPSPGWQVLLAHAQKHLLDLYSVLKQQAMMQASQQIGAQLQEAALMARMQMQMFQPPAPEQVQQQIHQVADQIFGQMAQQLQQLVSIFQQAAQAAQSKAPQQPADPAITAQVQIASMENDRKSKLDQATLALKQQESAAENALKNVEMQMAQRQQQFDEMMAQQTARLEAMAAQMEQQVQLQKNDDDNRQHQITEMLKNHEDNQTNLMMEQMRQEGLQQRHELETTFKEQQAKLDTMMNMVTTIATARASNSGEGDSKAPLASHPELTKMLETMHNVISTLSRPKQILRDEKGKVIGIGPQASEEAPKATMTLEEMQSALAALTKPKTIVRDANGRVIGVQ
jgi:hypothetical protein